jgi:uncharacterized protein YerC
MSVNGVTVAGCDCGCGQSSTNSTEPTVIYPLYNSAVYNSATELAKGIAELATQAETNAGTDDEKIVTPLKLQRRLYDSANTTTGVASATLNKINGTIEYSSQFSSALPKIFTLLNNLVTLNTKLVWSIKYPNQLGDEVVYPLAYQTSTGSIVFYVGIVNGTASDSPIEITYTILNP